MPESRARQALREMTREAEADGLLDVGTGFIHTRGPREGEPIEHRPGGAPDDGGPATLNP